MKSTIDAAGRVVIPKALRTAAGLVPGAAIEIELRDGTIAIEPASVPMRLVTRARGATIEAEADMPTLTSEDVRSALEHVRR
jgi:AbrB family looped-hinge helix DNA binding protein